jgi:hypothetical protein
MPTNAGHDTRDEQGRQSVTVAEAIKTLKALRAELADLRMLVRAAGTSGDCAGADAPTSVSRPSVDCRRGEAQNDRSASSIPSTD